MLDFPPLTVKAGEELDWGTLNVHEMSEKARKERLEEQNREAGTENGPTKVHLQPFATVKFRRVNGLGDPVSGRTQFEFDSGRQSMYARTTPVSSSGEMMIPDDDLGTINIDDRLANTFNIDPKKRPQPKRTKPKATQDESSGTLPPAFQEDTTLPSAKVSGVVVDLNGMTVADAEISTFKGATKTSAADGSFSLFLPEDVIASYPTGRPYVTMRKVGWDAGGL